MSSPLLPRDLDLDRLYQVPEDLRVEEGGGRGTEEVFFFTFEREVWGERVRPRTVTSLWTLRESPETFSGPVPGKGRTVPYGLREAIDPLLTRFPQPRETGPVERTSTGVYWRGSGGRGLRG